jgi:hypothetical protein
MRTFGDSRRRRYTPQTGRLLSFHLDRASKRRSFRYTAKKLIHELNQ